MSDTTNAEPATCGLCGKPVKGYASIGDVRYCGAFDYDGDNNWKFNDE